MIRLAIMTLAVLALIAPAGTLAADAPAPDARTYTDPAMTFVAPAPFQKLAVPAHDPAKFDDKAVMAAFVKNGGTQNAVSIVIVMDAFQGDATAFALQSDNELRGNTDGAFIKRTNITLSNGMPAIWEAVTSGTGFDQMQTYRCLWADGVRGVTVIESALSLTIDERQAKADLASLSAVAYPKYRY